MQALSVNLSAKLINRLEGIEKQENHIEAYLEVQDIHKEIALALTVSHRDSPPNQYHTQKAQHEYETLVHYLLEVGDCTLKWLHLDKIDGLDLA